MTREEIDTLWHQALQESVKAGEQFTRYHFAALVAEAAYKRGHDEGGKDFETIVLPAAVAAEREACADKTGEFARKWWSIHCASNKHMETTRKAHDDFCALQAAIRAGVQS